MEQSTSLEAISFSTSQKPPLLVIGTNVSLPHKLKTKNNAQLLGKFQQFFLYIQRLIRTSQCRSSLTQKIIKGCAVHTIK
jgi:hypothetical protein